LFCYETIYKSNEGSFGSEPGQNNQAAAAEKDVRM
jgi:hypothetical protein